MGLGYKEKIMMHSLYPKRMHSSDTAIIRYLLFYTCLAELAEKNIMWIDNGRLWCKGSETGDPVLDSVLDLILPLSGKRLSRLQLLVPQKAGGICKKQMELMTGKNYLIREDIRLISWKVGTRYRVRKYDLLKPGITKLERALVYGRSPDRETWVLALLLDSGQLFKNIFSIREFREKAKQRLKELAKSESFDNQTIPLLIRTLRKSLNTRKATKGAAAG